MSKTNALETAWNTYIFNDVDLANIGNAAGLQNTGGSSTFWLALFSQSPGESGSITYEVNYTGYVRKSVARVGASIFTVSANNVTNAGTISFAACTAGTSYAYYMGICSAATGTNVMYYGALATPISITNGVTPQILAGDFDLNEY